MLASARLGTRAVRAEAVARGVLLMVQLALSLNGDLKGKSGISAANLQFAQQLGVTHVVFSDDYGHLLSKSDGFWHYQELLAVKRRIEAGGLRLAAIENFPADHWHHIIMGTEGREVQMQNLSKTITNMGLAGVP